MGKTTIKVDYKKRSIKIFSQALEKELKEVIYLACCYNATFKFDENESIFIVNCYSDDAVEMLKEDFQEYFFRK